MKHRQERQPSPWRYDRAPTRDEIRLESPGQPEHPEPPCPGAGPHPAGSEESWLPSREDPCFCVRQKLRRGPWWWWGTRSRPAKGLLRLPPFTHRSPCSGLCVPVTEVGCLSKPNTWHQTTNKILWLLVFLSLPQTYALGGSCAPCLCPTP